MNNGPNIYIWHKDDVRAVMECVAWCKLPEKHTKPDEETIARADQLLNNPSPWKGQQVKWIQAKWSLDSE